MVGTVESADRREPDPRSLGADLPGHRRWVVEVKHGLSPVLSKGFHTAVADLNPERAFVVYSGTERYPKAQNAEVIGLREFASDLAHLAPSGG